MNRLRLFAVFAGASAVLVVPAFADARAPRVNVPDSFAEHDRTISDLLESGGTLSGEIVLGPEVLPTLEVQERLLEELDSMNRTIEPNGLEKFMLRAEDVPPRSGDSLRFRAWTLVSPFDKGIDGAAAVWAMDYGRTFLSDTRNFDASGNVEPAPPYEFTQSIMVMMTRYESLDAMSRNRQLREEAGLLMRPSAGSHTVDAEEVVVLVGEDETAEEVLARWGDREVIARDAARFGPDGYGEVSSLPRLADSNRSSIVYWATTETWFFTLGRYEVSVVVNGYSDSPAPPADVETLGLVALLYERLQSAPQ